MPESMMPIGTVTIAHGNAIAEGADGIRPLGAESPVYADETIKTTGAGSAVEIKFLDGAVLSQGPNSTVVLDDYVYDAVQSTGEMAVKLLQGTLRSVTGEIVDTNPEGFRIETPLATIGIRGTTTGHVVGANGTEQHVVVDFVDRAVVIGHEGEPPRVITQDGMGVMATPGGLGPVLPAPPGVLSNLNQLSSDALQQGAPTFRGDETGEEEEQGNNDDNDTPSDGQEAQGQGQQAGEAGEGQGEQGGEGQPEQFSMNPQMGMAAAMAVGPTGPVVPVVPAMTPPPAPTSGQGAPSGQQVQDTTTELVETATEAAALPTTLDLSAETSAVTVDLSASPSAVTVGADSYTIGSSYKNVTGSSTATNTLTGDGQANILIGGSDTDTLMGGDGDDTIYGSGGNNLLYGGDESTDTSSNDVLSYALVGASVDVDLSAGTASYSGNTDTISGFEHVIGSSSADTLWGDSDDNILKGGDGADTIWGGSGGADSLYGQGGDDVLKIHNDLTGGLLDGGDGTDVLRPWADGIYDITGIESATDIEGVVFGTTASNLILQAADFGFDEAISFDVDSASSSGSQYLEVKSSATNSGDTETIDLSAWTYSGNWTGGSGYIKLTGDVGDETFKLGSNMSSKVTLDGGDGTDTLYFTDSGGTSDLNNMVNIEKVVLGDANTSVRTLCASVQSNLTVDATAITSSHTFEWDGSNETDYSFIITGGEGQNTIIGGLQADTISGGSSDDVLQGYGGLGDSLTGGGGNDTFVYEDASYCEDFITDFGDGEDKFQISNIFSGASGAYDGSQFVRVTDAYIGNESLLANEGFIYEVVDSSTGKLWYDSDGSSDGSETLIATITMHTDGDEVVAGDIDVV